MHILDIMLELTKQFRPSTSQTYPPFKNGRYMEEYAYEYFLKNPLQSATYIPIFWTNLQNHPGFKEMKPKYNKLLQVAFANASSWNNYIWSMYWYDSFTINL